MERLKSITAEVESTLDLYRRGGESMPRGIRLSGSDVNYLLNLKPPGPYLYTESRNELVPRRPFQHISYQGVLLWHDWSKSDVRYPAETVAPSKPQQDVPGATTIRLGAEAEAALASLCARWQTTDHSTAIRRALVDYAELLQAVEPLCPAIEAHGYIPRTDVTEPGSANVAARMTVERASRYLRFAAMADARGDKGRAARWRARADADR